MSTGRIEWYCLLFFMGCMLLNTWMLIRSLKNEGSGASFHSVTQPKMMWQPPPGHLVVDTTFRHMMDSIQADPVLKKRLDSMMVARPDFAERIRHLEWLHPKLR